jgi:hypothetical protein
MERAVRSERFETNRRSDLMPKVFTRIIFGTGGLPGPEEYRCHYKGLALL